MPHTKIIFSNEKDLDYYWREFAAALPKEEKANSARMMNMHPHLLNDTTFEVTVDNDMVEKYMVQLIPSVQNHLRERLHNRKITYDGTCQCPYREHPCLQPCGTFPDDEQEKPRIC